MDYVLLWFILHGGAGYIEPLKVQHPPCGVAGAVVGVTFDRAINPTTVTWPDPYFPETHCVIDIRAKVATLPEGTYELATTEVGKGGPFGTAVRYNGIDPHTTQPWVRRPGAATPPRQPTTFRVVRTGDNQ